MEWKKIKTILIVFLLLANAMLGGLYLQRIQETEQTETDASVHLVSLLKTRGVTLDPQLVVFCLDLSARPLYIQRDTTIEKMWVSRWIGDAALTVLPDQTNVYRSDEGAVTVYTDGKMDIVRQSPAPATRTDVRENLSAFLGGLTDGKPSQMELRDGDTVAWPQTADGLPVFDAELTVRHRDGGLLGASGTALLGQIFWGEESVIPSVSLPLLRYFSRDESSAVHIEQMTLGYLSSPLKNNVTRLWPVWRLTVDGRILYLDAYTGEAKMVS